MRLLIKNIGPIVGIDQGGRERVAGADMASVGTLDDAWLVAERGIISDYGQMSRLPQIDADETIDAGGGMLFPSFCDSHTHIVYAGSRRSSSTRSTV